MNDCSGTDTRELHVVVADSMEPLALLPASVILRPIRERGYKANPSRNQTQPLP